MGAVAVSQLLQDVAESHGNDTTSSTKRLYLGRRPGGLYLSKSTVRFPTELSHITCHVCMMCASIMGTVAVSQLIQDGSWIS